MQKQFTARAARNCLSVRLDGHHQEVYFGDQDFRVRGAHRNQHGWLQPALSEEIIHGGEGLHPAIVAFRIQLPDRLLREAQSFPSSVAWWVLRILAAAAKAGVQVTRSPAFILLSALYTAQWPEAEFSFLVKWVDRSCYDILAELGLPARPAILRILGKIVELDDVAALVALKNAIAADTHLIRRLCQQAVISWPLMDAVAKGVPAEHLTAGLVRFLNELTWLPFQFESPGSLLSEILENARTIGLGRCPWIGLHTENAFFRLRERLAGKANLARLGSLVLAAPLPSLSGLTPLVTAAQIAEEGRLMGNCLFSLIDSISLGQRFAYRVESPGCRATLVIEHVMGANRPNPFWVRLALVGPRNAPVSAETAERIDAWLIQAQSLDRTDYDGTRQACDTGVY